MLQRRLDMPDATVLVLQGLAFLLVLASESLYGRFRFARRESAPKSRALRIAAGSVSRPAVASQ